MACLSHSPRFWLNCLGCSQALVCFKSYPCDSKVRAKNQALGSIFIGLPTSSFNKSRSPILRQTLCSLLEVLSPKLSETQLLAMTQNPGASDLKANEHITQPMPTWGPSRPLLFLNEPHCLPFTPPRPYLPPRQERKGQSVEFLAAGESLKSFLWAAHGWAQTCQCLHTVTPNIG